MSHDHQSRRRFADRVVSRLREAGHLAYWAGGCVRDLLLGLEPSDYDVATDARPERVTALFPKTIPVGVSFGVVRVRGPRGAGEVEVATFRSDGEYLDGRRPDSVRFGTPEADAARRDFTVNGLFLDPADGRVIDYVGGRADLDRKLLRAIGDPAERFAEDKLRLLRAVRFAARFGFTIESTTADAIRSMAPAVRVVAAERIAQELAKMFADDRRARAVGLAAELGLLAAVLPDLARLRDSPGDPDRWTISLSALANLPGRPGIALGLATIWDGLGPPLMDHAEAVAAAESAAIALKLSNADRDQLVWLVAHRSLLDGLMDLPESERKRRLAAPGLPDLLTVREAIGRAEGADLDSLAAVRRYRAEQPEGPIDPPPLLNGSDLRIQFGLVPGPRFKELLGLVRDAQLSRVFEDRAGALEWLGRRLESPGGAG